MPWFEYEGTCLNGTAIAGRIEAESHDAACRMLTETMQLTISDLRAAATSPPRTPIGADDFIFFNEQLASLASAGIALDEGLQQIARDVTSPRLRRLIEAVAADLRRGEPLERAIARHEADLPVLYSRVIRAGVQSGQLSATLLSLNQHLRLMGETRRLLWETLTYPLFVLLLAMGIASLFLVFIVPKFREIFHDFGTQLPFVTMLLLDAADVFPTVLIVAGVAVVAAAVAWRILQTTPGGRAVREAIIAHIPVVGRVYRASLVARFVRSVATCVQAGITLPETLRLAGGVTGSPRIGIEAERAAVAVEQGRSVLDAEQKGAWIPGIFGYTVQVSLGRDALPAALLQLSRTYEARAVYIQGLLRALLLPTLVVVVGLMIGFGVIALFMPLVSLINCVSGG